MSGTAWIGLGSNLGDPELNLRHATRLIGQPGHTRLLAHSSLYRTRPWGNEDQADFCNAVISVETQLDPEALLAALLDIEGAMGRQRGAEQWGPRLIDLDLLLYDDLEWNSTSLQLPHPRMHERAFVLIPLLEISPGLEIPSKGLARDCLAPIADPGVERLRKEY